MTLLLALIALPGIAAVLVRWFAAVFGMARHSVERYVAGQIADNRAQRGDISGMSEAESIRRRSGAEQMRLLLQVLGWTGLLVAPLLLPASLVFYALYGLLWLVPRPTRATE